MKLTAEGYFITANSELRNLAKEWLKTTAEGCSVVAVLIATVAFAAAYTVPGGPNQSTGVPVLLYLGTLSNVVESKPLIPTFHEISHM
ncbi:hypothetical protein D5086_021278 [Populus alba]|uniref:Uncharacterized protein n=1 Tax=Populus alba TaxID=43335 RepID=A0ACC4BCA2_POPAL